MFHSQSPAGRGRGVERRRFSSAPSRPSPVPKPGTSFTYRQMVPSSPLSPEIWSSTARDEPFHPGGWTPKGQCSSEIIRESVGSFGTPRSESPRWDYSPRKDDDDSGSPEKCDFCNRPQKHILCRSCGHMFTGRVRVKCTRHPEIIHLMDCDGCPKCRTFQLMELKQ